jgi:FTR1 family protein
MLSALIVALREGVEAALVVGIVLVYLHRTGRAALARWVWIGVSLAVLGSVAGALILERWQVNQEGVEGVLMLLAAVFVVSMVWWMRRVARTLKQDIEQRVETYAQRGAAAGMGLCLFVLLMVLREGIELVLIVRAVEASSEGVAVSAGTAVGLALAVALGLFFFKGTLRIPLERFFAATSAMLMVVAVQLAVTGVHELSEAMWIPSSKKEMAIIGPIVRNDIVFFAFVLGVAAVMAFREWLSARKGQPVPQASLDEWKRWERDQRRHRRWTFAAAFTTLAIAAGLTADFLHAQANAGGPPEARPVEVQAGMVRLPAGLLLHRVQYFSVDVTGQSIRFFVVRKPNGSYVAALDACRICGPASNRVQGDDLICLNCGAVIPMAFLEDKGGCNPVVVPSHQEGGELVLDTAVMLKALPEKPTE